MNCNNSGLQLGGDSLFGKSTTIVYQTVVSTNLQLIYNLFTTYLKLIYNLFKTYLKLIYNLFTTNLQLIYN